MPQPGRPDEGTAKYANYAKGAEAGVKRKDTKGADRRSGKSEIRNPKQIRTNGNGQNAKTGRAQSAKGKSKEPLKTRITRKERKAR